MKNFFYLLLANGIIWAAIFGYVYSLSRRGKELDREIKALKEQLDTEHRGQSTEHRA